MWVALSALVSCACVVSCLRRLSWVVSPVGVDPRLLAKHLSKPGVDASLLGAALGDAPEMAWERELFAAFGCSDLAERDALVNEQLLELQWRVERWTRVPRVCASIASSSAFLFASISLIEGLSALRPLEDVGSAVFPALDALSIGLAGASFCVAVHVRARRVAREWLTAADRLVSLMDPTPLPAARVR